MPAIRLLLVDDEESLRITLAANLEMSGFEIIEAENGQRALEIVKEREVDLVLTDIRMPGLNGIQLFSAIKQVRPDMPVILMTAFAVEGHVQGAVLQGAFTVLPKPFDVDDMAKILLRAVK